MNVCTVFFSVALSCVGSLVISRISVQIVIPNDQIREKGGSEGEEADNMVSHGLDWKRRRATGLFYHRNTPIGRLFYSARITKAGQERFVNYIKDSGWRKSEDEILCQEIPIPDQPRHSEVSVTFLVFTIGERCTAVTRLFATRCFTTFRRP